MLAALLLNLSGAIQAPRLGKAQWWPYRASKREREDYPVAEQLIEALPAAEAKRIDIAIEKAVEAVIEDRPADVIDYADIWNKVFINVGGEVRRDIQSILQDQKIRKVRLRELFEAEVRERLRQEEEELETVLLLAFA